MDEIEVFKRLGLALAIGLLLGMERGWQQRNAPPGGRVAGVRTFALMGLMGGLWSLLTLQAGDLAMGLGFLAFAILVVAAHVVGMRNTTEGVGITTESAELLTFLLGGLAVRGQMEVAAAGGVVVLALLSLKDAMHRFVSRLESTEIRAAIRLLLISVVLLPLLPNHGYGPGGTLNPYRLWWVVVMIAAISFVGYVAIKVAGPRIGTMLTGFFGGIASSTALTLSFARLGKDVPELQRMLAAGVSVAAGTMFLRILLIVVVLCPPMMKTLSVPMGIMALVSYLGAWVLWWTGRGIGMASSTPLTNPFELGTAIKFGAFLAAVLLASRLLQDYVGDNGVLALAAVSGLADVDAISVSMARMANLGMSLSTAVDGVVIAAFVNTVVKGAMVVFLCGGTMGRRVALTFGLICASGAAALVMV